SGGNGGVYNANLLRMSRCTLQNNSGGIGGMGSINGGPSGIGGAGGGFFNAGTFSVDRCLILSNSSGKGGQGYRYNNGSDGGSGGGLYNARNLTISHTTIS